MKPFIYLPFIGYLLVSIFLLLFSGCIFQTECSKCRDAMQSLNDQPREVFFNDINLQVDLKLYYQYDECPLYYDEEHDIYLYKYIQICNSASFDFLHEYGRMSYTLGLYASESLQTLPYHGWVACYEGNRTPNKITWDFLQTHNSIIYLYVFNMIRLGCYDECGVRENPDIWGKLADSMEVLKLSLNADNELEYELIGSPLEEGGPAEEVPAWSPIKSISYIEYEGEELEVCPEYSNSD